MQKKNKTNILHYLSALADKRRVAGQRHPMTIVLLIIVMGVMNGSQGYRSLGDFVERHRKALINLLQIKKKRVPSYSTLRRVIMAVEVDELSKAFHQWAIQSVSIGKREWMAIDGKSIEGTVRDAYEPMQDFVNLVSLYASKKNLVINTVVSSNKKESEIKVVQRLIEALELKDVIFTLDALHCQKKRQKSLSIAEMTM